MQNDEATGFSCQYFSRSSHEHKITSTSTLIVKSESNPYERSKGSSAKHMIQPPDEHCSSWLVVGTLLNCSTLSFCRQTFRNLSKTGYQLQASRRSADRRCLQNAAFCSLFWLHVQSAAFDGEASVLHEFSNHPHGVVLLSAGYKHSAADLCGSRPNSLLAQVSDNPFQISPTI